MGMDIWWTCTHGMDMDSWYRQGLLFETLTHTLKSHMYEIAETVSHFAKTYNKKKGNLCVLNVFHKFVLCFLYHLYAHKKHFLHILLGKCVT